MARTVADAALILDAISGHDPRDPASLELPPTRLAAHVSDDINGKVIGINEDFFFKDVDDSVASIVRHGIRCLEDRGALIKPVDIRHIASAEYAITIIDISETSTVHHRALRERPQDYGDDVRFLLRCGELPSAVDYLEAQQIRSQLRDSFREVFNEVDVLVAPTLPIETPDVGQKTSTINGKTVDAVASLMRLIGPSNLVGLPSVSVPCGALHGMPVGMQIVGAPLHEAAVMNIARAVESAKLYTLAMPPCSGGRARA
jgi:aspartyl-tRNA(Asn)/glutamyl-tRNA(Gln) amidotransferase subunit A